jgi:RimJ/RimL family protein N-acetyltransferase
LPGGTPVLVSFVALTPPYRRAVTIGDFTTVCVLRPPDLGPDGAREFLRMDAEVRRSGTGAHLVVTDAASVVVGDASLTNIDSDDRSAFTGFWVAARVRRRGIATRILRLVSKWGFETPGLHRICLTTDPRNVASQRVAERVGYRRGGTRDRASPTAGGRYEDVLYRLSRGDFNPVAGSN